jgi:glucose/mannose-6-phosphate isomerase
MQREEGSEMSDPIELLAQHDKQDMAGFTRGFVDDLENAFQKDIGIIGDDDWVGVLCIGMGGSGAGGTFLTSIADRQAGLPVLYWRDYGLPSWWGPEWLIIATSYSGNTEETLDGVSKALEEGGSVIGISSGGKLEELLSDREDAVHIAVPSGQMPRSAFGHLIGTQLSLLWSMGLLPAPKDEDIGDMIGRLRQLSSDWDPSTGSTLAYEIAKSIGENGIGIVSPSIMGCAARRFVGQLNENSSLFARSSEVPEMNHNEIIPWTERASENQALVMIHSSLSKDRTSSRMKWFEEHSGDTARVILNATGETLVEQLLGLAHITDWISIMLAVSRGVDPSEMAAIPSLKAHLEEIQ